MGKVGSHNYNPSFVEWWPDYFTGWLGPIGDETLPSYNKPWNKGHY